MSACPDNRCDGSGFVYDERPRRARACSCRAQRLARKRAAAVAGRLPRRFREIGFDREPLLSIERANPIVARDVRSYVRGIADNLAAGRELPERFRGRERERVFLTALTPQELEAALAC